MRFEPVPCEHCVPKAYHAPFPMRAKPVTILAAHQVRIIIAISVWTCNKFTFEHIHDSRSNFHLHFSTSQKPFRPHSLRLHLKDNDETRAIWDHPFHLIYDLQLLDSNKLRTTLQILNTGPTAFDFHLLFHPYFKAS